MSNSNPIVLIILDGWGYRDDPQHNAIAAAQTPQWQTWWQKHPHMLLNASGNDVGLPDHQMGNSEVGHMHLGAGRRVLQDFTFINQAIASGDFVKNATLLTALTQLQANGHALHVMGLFSPGGVHSHQDHLFAFLKFCSQHKFSNVYLHLFLDGRDTSPKQVKVNLLQLTSLLKQHPVARICSITGRYWAMDRDQRWSRVEPVYSLLTEGKGLHQFSSAEEAIDTYYAQGISDEFFPATQIGEPAPINNGDAVFYFNFRADRAKQLTQAFLSKEFQGFERKIIPQLSQFLTMTSYDPSLPTDCVFPRRTLNQTLGEVLSQHKLRQLRIAETEKYAHVTFFFNGGEEHTFPLEDRILIPSPKVKTYDLQPEMSAPQLTQALIEAIESQVYDVIICNYANADMVGHTGNFQAAVTAIEAIDTALHAIGVALQKVNGHLLITADHGNAECMFDEDTHQAHTAHTCERVPLLYVGDPNYHFKQSIGSLSDVAPTLLALLKLTPPKEMTGTILWADSNV